MSIYHLDIQDIKVSLAAIKMNAGVDDEAAHTIESDLYFRFLVLIANTPALRDKPYNHYRLAMLQKMAQLILTSKDIEFARYMS